MTVARHILLTGSSRGLGATLCANLVERGHTISALVRTPGEPSDAVNQIGVDLTDLNALSAAVDKAESVAHIDALINCAGIGLDGLLVTQSEQELLSMGQVNFLAPMLLMRQVSKHMMRRRNGRIINISSVSGHRALRGLTAYGAFKAALNQLTVGFAAEMGSRGIAVNAIAPGYLETDMTQGLRQDQLNSILRRTPAVRSATTGDVSELVDFLLDAPITYTGQIMTLDGGFSL